MSVKYWETNNMLNLFKFFKRKKRAVERVPVKMVVPVEVVFQFNYANRDYTGILKDISVNGFGFFSAKFLETGREIELEITFECKDPDTDFRWVMLKERALIKWVAVNHSANLVDYDVGCEFTQPADENRKKLAKILQYVLNNSAK